MRHRRWLLPAAVGVAGYFALFGGEYNALEGWLLEKRQAREAAELVEVKASVEDLRTRADSLASDSAVLERLARERYGLIREGERLYRFVGGDSVGEVEGVNPGADSRGDARRPGEKDGGRAPNRHDP